MNQSILYIYSSLFFLAELFAKVIRFLFPSELTFFCNRKKIFDKLEQVKKERFHYKNCVFFYCSSAGEYEQAKPLFKPLQERGCFILILFFSSNGYKHATSLNESINYFMAPLDILWYWKKLYKNLNPTTTFVVRHEFWPSFINVAGLYSRLYAIDVTVRINSPLISKKIKVLLLKYFDLIFVVDDKDEKILKKYSKISNIVVSGDTKYDRLLDRKSEEEEKRNQIRSKLENIAKHRKIFCIGSAYLNDIKFIIKVFKDKQYQFKKKWLLVVVPHDVSKISLKKFESFFILEKLVYGKISALNKHNYNSSNLNVEIVLVDVLGELFNFYGISDLSFVGGGFDKGVHNILEPAAFSVPISSGPRIEDEIIARRFNELNLLYTFNRHQDFAKWWLQNNTSDEKYKRRMDIQLKKETKCRKIIMGLIDY